jgi:hypothetical protein
MMDKGLYKRSFQLIWDYVIDKKKRCMSLNIDLYFNIFVDNKSTWKNINTKKSLMFELEK